MNTLKEAELQIGLLAFCQLWLFGIYGTYGIYGIYGI